MGRRDGPELPSAEVAHVETAIASSAEGRSLVICPVLARQPIGREALPPIISVAVAPCVKTADHTGTTELVLCANCESLQSDLIRARSPICTKEQKRAEWVGSFGHGRSAHAKAATGRSHQGSSYDRKTDPLIPDLPSR